MGRLRWAALALSMLATGCYRVTYLAPHVMPGEVKEKTPDFFFWGLMGDVHYDLRSFCPGEVERVRTGMSILNAIATFFTLGIYAPRTVSVTCALGTTPTASASDRTYEIALDDVGNPVRVVESDAAGVRLGSVSPAGPHRWRIDYAAEAQR